MDELKYKNEDMPMCINKILYFEKRNNLSINVYGFAEDNKSIVPIYVSSNRDKINYILIHLSLIYLKLYYIYLNHLTSILNAK